VFYLEKGLVVEDKRKEPTGVVKELQESSWVAKFIFDKVEDPDVGEVHEMYCELSHLHQEIQLLFSTGTEVGSQMLVV
jgi:hypothetical protein